MQILNIPQTRYTRSLKIHAGRNKGVTGGFGFSLSVEDDSAAFMAVGLWNRFGQRSLVTYNGLSERGR